MSACLEMGEATSELINLQKQINDVEVEFDLRRTLLDYKHDNVLKEAYERRAQIIVKLNAIEKAKGDMSITTLDSRNCYSNLMNTCSVNEVNNNNNNNNSKSATNTRQSSNLKKEEFERGDSSVHHKASPKGFWITVFLNSRQLSTRIQEHDRDALSHLINVSSTTDITNLKSEKKFSFLLSFHFSSNPYFHNRVLTKEYFVDIKVDMANPIQYYGPRICRSVGCQINWKPGMDLTKRLPPQRPPRNSVSSVLTKTTPPSTTSPTTNFGQQQNNNNRSRHQQFKIKEWVLSGGKSTFFNYFSFPELPDGIPLDTEDETLVDKDFQLGWHIKDDIIPRALFYFLGNVPDSGNDDSSETSSSGSSVGDGDSNSGSSGSSPDCIEKCRCRNAK